MKMEKLAMGIAPVAVLLALALVGLPATASAQLTSGTIAGTVRAASDNSPLPGATVTVVHVPTGTVSTVYANADGRFVVPNLRVGGPYEVTATLDSFQTRTVTDVNVRLGAATDLTFALELATISEEISVVGSASELINPNKMGSGSSVTRDEIESFPTVRRSPLDFVRTNPYFSIRGGDENEKDVSVAGKSNKYNNIQIDGASYNDLFGLGESGGTPGGQANAQPIIIDAIQEVQLNVSPYDVRQGGFTGGAINAVTKSGTNEFHGSAYYAQRDPDYVGDGPSGRPVSEFDEEQIGLSLGGRLIPDKLFFFVAAEQNSRTSPTGFSADGSSGQLSDPDTSPAAVKQILETQYGYNPGGLGDFGQDQDSDHLFFRLDWNAHPSHQVTFRHNVIDALRDDVSNRSEQVYRFEKATFTRDADTASTVLQLNSVFGSSMFNEARIGLQSIEDVRSIPEAFPTVVVGGSNIFAGDVIAGTEQFSGRNIINQDILELTDDFTFLKGNHTITVGTHNEFFEFENFFFSNFYGAYWFPTLDDLAAGVAAEYQISFATGDDPGRPTAQFDVQQLGVYVGDVWRQRDNLTFTYGLRIDQANLPDSPTFNPTILSALGIDNSKVPDGETIISPRVGFNWDPDGRGVQQLRGGIGIFAGRTPYVWIGNAYGGTGIETIASTTRGMIPFNPDPNNQIRGGALGRATVDLVDENFQFPQVLRATLGYDRELPWWNLRGTVELLWSDVQEDVFWQNRNKVRTGTSPFDGRPTYSTISSQIFDAPYLTNTSEGGETVLAIVLTRPSIDGFGFRAGYTYTDTESGFEGTSSRHISNWRNQPTRGDIDSPETFESPYANEHRFYGNAYYSFETGRVRHNLGAQYVAESGRPYSLLMDFDANGDGYRTNDLLYIPSSPDEVIFQGITYDQFRRYLSWHGVGGSGRIVGRNESHMPWTHRFDVHYGLELPFSRFSAEVTLDVLNVGNLIDSDSGVVKYVNFNTVFPIEASVDSATGKLIYRENFGDSITDPDSTFTTADLASRWQARLGLKVRF